MMQTPVLSTRPQPARLQDDILCELFHILAEDDAPARAFGRPGERYHRPVSLGWLRVTHVCRHWRKTGLDMSKLWADIICVFPRGAATIAERTKTQLLNLDLDASVQADDAWDLIRSHEWLPRAHTFEYQPYLDRYTPSRHDWPEVLLQYRTLPQLQNLSLALREFSYSTLEPKPVLVAPNLRRLTLGYPLAVAAPALTHFLSTGPLWPYRLYLDLFRRHPSLEEITINGVYGDDPRMEEIMSAASQTSLQLMVGELDALSTVRLSHLRSLRILWPGPEAINLLHHLDLPLDCSFVTEHVREQSYLAPLLLAVKATFRSRHATLTLTDTTINYVKTIQISMTKDQPYLDTASDLEDFDDGVLMCASLANSDIPDVLSIVPDPSSLSTLAFHHDCHRCKSVECLGTFGGDVDPYELGLSLKDYTNVNTLHLVDQGGYTGVFAFLTVEVSPGNLVLPALRTLVIELDYVSSTIWWSCLREILLRRTAVGGRIERLVVRGEFACHAYVLKEDKEEYARITSCVEGNPDDMNAAWLKQCEVTLLPEKELVVEVVDERDLDACDCATAISEGRFPGYGDWEEEDDTDTTFTSDSE
ncbi:unnamed protein product [Peniophora sp. CBMAI 1063]|nr:unnamed protein product [Peniophora sp. CBMAI 1063]